MFELLDPSFSLLSALSAVIPACVREWLECPGPQLPDRDEFPPVDESRRKALYPKPLTMSSNTKENLAWCLGQLIAALDRIGNDRDRAADMDRLTDDEKSVSKKFYTWLTSYTKGRPLRLYVP